MKAMLSQHIRSNVVGYLAVFIALGGTAYASHPGGNNTIDSGDIKNKAVASVDVKQSTLKSDDIKDGTITSADVKQGTLKSGDIKNGGVGLADLAFVPSLTSDLVSLKSELDSHKASGDHDGRYFTEPELQSVGTLNDAGNPVDWTKLKNVPAGFADGTDDGGGGRRWLVADRQRGHKPGDRLPRHDRQPAAQPAR
jgi:hypothetical protein